MQYKKQLISNKCHPALLIADLSMIICVIIDYINEDMPKILPDRAFLPRKSLISS